MLVILKNKNFLQRVEFLKSSAKFFTRGGVLTVGYRLRGFGFIFTGLCLSVRGKSMLSGSSTFILRNIFSKISVEVHVLIYGLCRLNFKFLDYARKKFMYRGSKLYYLRGKSNTES
jgi:hypothetical protein